MLFLLLLSSALAVQGCPGNWFSCRNGLGGLLRTGCVPRSYVCDGDRDCMDGSDETNCEEHSQFDDLQCAHRCGNLCMDAAFFCDGETDCDDNSDEASCSLNVVNVDPVCPDGYFKCTGKKQCIPMKKRCDGLRDCLHGSDERDCPWVPGNCDGECNGECIEFGARHICKEGLVSPSCTPSRSTKRQNVTITVVASTKIVAYNTSNRVMTVLSDYLAMAPDMIIYPKAAVYDNRRFKLYHSNVFYPKIIECDVSLKERKTAIGPTLLGISRGDDNCKVIIEGGVGAVDGLALNHRDSVLLWTDSKMSTISQYNTVTGERKVVMDKEQGVNHPHAIVVDEDNDNVFWVDLDAGNPRINKASQNFTARTVLVQGKEKLRRPNGLAVDPVNKVLFWVDGELEQLCSVDYEGNNFRVLAKDSQALSKDSKVLGHPYGIGYHQGRIYWSDWDTNTLFSADSCVVEKVTMEFSLLHPGFGRIMGFYFV